MKHTLILCLFLVFCQTSGECSTAFFPPLQPVNQPTTIQTYNDNIANLSDAFINSNNKYPNITRIEKFLFGKTYENQNISIRLSRIEKSLFTTTYQNASETQRIDNIISNFNQINKYPNISQNNLSKMEIKVFKQVFSQNNPQRRIERLEQQIFGAIQSGDLNSRYEALKIALNTYNKKIYSNNVLTSDGINQKGWRGIVSNLGSSMLGGTMTGFTPPINPYYGNYNAYTNPYGNGQGGIYRSYGETNGLGGYRFYNNHQNFGTGTGVTILD